MEGGTDRHCVGVLHIQDYGWEVHSCFPVLVLQGRVPPGSQRDPPCPGHFLIEDRNMRCESKELFFLSIMSPRH